MVTIKGPSNSCCFICGTKERTADVQFADKTFRGVLCMEDIYKKLKQAEKREPVPAKS